MKAHDVSVEPTVDMSVFLIFGVQPILSAKQGKKCRLDIDTDSNHAVYAGLVAVISIHVRDFDPVCSMEASTCVALTCSCSSSFLKRFLHRQPDAFQLSMPTTVATVCMWST